MSEYQKHEWLDGDGKYNIAYVRTLSEADILRKAIPEAVDYDGCAILVKRLASIDPAFKHTDGCVPLWFLHGYASPEAFDEAVERQMRFVLYNDKPYLFILP